jgi:hypothetical protein
MSDTNKKLLLAIKTCSKMDLGTRCNRIFVKNATVTILITFRYIFPQSMPSNKVLNFRFGVFTEVL